MRHLLAGLKRSFAQRDLPTELAIPGLKKPGIAHCGWSPAKLARHGHRRHSAPLYERGWTVTASAECGWQANRPAEDSGRHHHAGTSICDSTAGCAEALNTRRASLEQDVQRWVPSLDV